MGPRAGRRRRHDFRKCSKWSSYGRFETTREPERLIVFSKPSRNCLLSIDFAITTKLALPLPQYSSRGCAGWEARVRVRLARKVVQAHLPMDGVLLASYFGRWASLPRR